MGENPLVELRTYVIDELVLFVRSLRRAGVSAPADGALGAGRVLASVGFERHVARAALRATLVRNPGDFPVFEALFDEFWRSLVDVSAREPEDMSEGLGHIDNLDQPTVESAEDNISRRDGRNQSEVIGNSTLLAEQNFDSLPRIDKRVTAAKYSPVGSSTPVSDPAAAGDRYQDTVVGHLTYSLATLRGRRHAPHDAGRPDIRRALRTSVATGGIVHAVPRRKRTEADVRGIVLVDVSRSVVDVVNEGFLLSFVQAIHKQ